MCVQVCVNECVCTASCPTACPLTKTPVRQSHGVNGWPLLRRRQPEKAHTPTYSKCCLLTSLFQFRLSFLLSLPHCRLPSFYCSLDFPLSAATLVSTFYVSFSQPPSLLCSLHLSQSLWQCVTLPPWGSHQFRWALHVTGQLCLFKPLAVLLLPPCHHSPLFTFSALFCVCVRISRCWLAIFALIYITNTASARVKNWQV